MFRIVMFYAFDPAGFINMVLWIFIREYNPIFKERVLTQVFKLMPSISGSKIQKFENLPHPYQE